MKKRTPVFDAMVAGICYVLFVLIGCAAIFAMLGVIRWLARWAFSV